MISAIFPTWIDNGRIGRSRMQINKSKQQNFKESTCFWNIWNKLISKLCWTSLFKKHKWERPETAITAVMFELQRSYRYYAFYCIVAETFRTYNKIKIPALVSIDSFFESVFSYTFVVSSTGLPSSILSFSFLLLILSFLSSDTSRCFLRFSVFPSFKSSRSLWALFRWR